MAKRKGSNPFGEYQMEKVGQRAEAIRRILSDLGRSRFEHLSSLATTVALQLTVVERREYDMACAKDGKNRKGIRLREPRPVNMTTLMRNTTYKSILIAHLAERGIVPRCGVGPVPKEISKMHHDLEIALLRKEVERLRRCAKGDRERNVSGSPALQGTQPRVEVLEDGNSYAVKTGILVQAINRILKYPGVGDLFLIDVEKRTVDVAKGLERSGRLWTREMSETYFDVLDSVHKMGG